MRQGSRWNPWNALVPRQWFLAIDTADADFVPGWRVSEADFLAIGRDDEVVALVDRRLRHVREIQRASLA